MNATCQALLARARIALQRGESVVLDASWSSGRWRDAACEVARETCSELIQLRCEAPVELAAHRIVARSARGGDASDATPALAATLAARFQPWPEAVAIDTDGPIARSQGQALAAARHAARPWLPAGPHR